MKTPQQIIYDSRDWKALEKKLSKMDSGQRGKVFEWFCVFYLQVESRHATTYKEVLHSDQFLKQTKIKKILGFTKNKEEGVDAIGIRHDGKIDIIQCKYLDRTDKNLAKTHVESSLDIANGKTAKPYVDTILMCSNAKGLTKNEDLRNRHPNIQFRTLLYGDYKHLKKDDFDKIRAVIEGAIPKHEPKNPRSYQEVTKNKIIEHFKKESRGQIVHACGTGKTLTSYFTYRELKPKITLFAVPSLQLLNQSLLEWTRESLADNNPISPFAVCSDKSNEKLGECEPELWLQEMGIRVSNKKEDLDIFLKSRRKNKVIFATYQSGDVLAKNIKALNKQIDFAFFDEAHNTATGKGKLSSHLLYDENIPIKKRLFMTATPKVFKGDSDTEIASMESEELYGKLIDEITVKDAIKGIDGFKLLNDYQIITHTVESSLYAHLLEENPFVIDKEQLPKQAEMRLLASAILLKKARKDKNIKNVVSFHSFRNRARAFEKGANIIDKELNTYYVDGTQSGTERLSILDDFVSNSPSLVSNAQCLSEGVNVPSIDAVLFVDPKQSRTGITQAIGRALRKGDSNKGMSYIIVPTIIDVEDPENNDKRYENILMVLTAMAQHDGRIIEYFTDIQNGKKPPKQFVEIDSEYSNEQINLEEFTKQLNYKAWNKLKTLAWRPFNEARDFVRKLGLNSLEEWERYKQTEDAPVDIPVRVDRYPEWISTYDFLGTKSPEDNLEQFINDFKNEVTKYELEDNEPLYLETEISGEELFEKARSYRKLSANQTLSLKARQKLVQELGYLWTDKPRHEYEWEKRFRQYIDWTKINKTSYVPGREKYKGYALGRWFARQNDDMKSINTNSSSLSKKEQKLISVGFPFKPKREYEWDKEYELAKELLPKHKGKIPNVNKKAHPTSRWISNQRTSYKENKLSQERIDRLESIKYWSWNPKDEWFINMIETLVEYIEETDIPNPHADTIYDDKAIGKFLGRLRRKEIADFDKLFTNKIKQRLIALGVGFKLKQSGGRWIYYN